jgi:hypothetical protein
MNVLPFFRIGRDNPVQKTKEDRNEETKPRSIHLPAWLWDALDRDAKRCKRSATKQLEAFLTLCFDPDADMEIDKADISTAHQVASHKRLKAG